MRAATVLGIVLFIHSADMQAQSGPSQVAESAFDALSHRDWPSLAALIDPAALDTLRQMSLGLVILFTEERKAGKEGGGYNPQDVRIPDHLPTLGAEHVSSFHGNPTIAQLASLSSSEFFIRWCEAVYGSVLAGDSVYDRVNLQRHIVGELLESDSLAHVLYRREARHVEVNELVIDLPGYLMVLPARKLQGQWRLEFNSDLGWLVDFMQAFNARHTIPAHTLKHITRIEPEPAIPANVGVGHGKPGPTEIARSAFDAFSRRDWPTLTALVDSGRLVAFQRAELAYLAVWVMSTKERAQAKTQGVTGFAFSYDDSLPPASAVAPVADVKAPVFPNDQTLGALAQLSPTMFFEHWCEAVYDKGPNWRPGATKIKWQRAIIGAVFEGQAVAHVLYRYGLKDLEKGPVERMPLKRTPSGWRLLLNDDIGSSLDFSVLLNNP